LTAAGRQTGSLVLWCTCNGHANAPGDKRVLICAWMVGYMF